MLVTPEVTYILYFPWSWKAASTVLPKNSLEAVAATTKFVRHIEIRVMIFSLWFSTKNCKCRQWCAQVYLIKSHVTVTEVCQ